MFYGIRGDLRKEKGVQKEIQIEHPKEWFKSPVKSVT